MSLQESLIASQEDNGIVLQVEVWERCRRAKLLEELGDYEGACQALGQYWQGVGKRPLLEGHSPLAQAELLLRTGTLSGWIGRVRQIDGAQEAAKDLLTDCSGMFERLGQPEKTAEAQIELAICYWREGGYDEARVTLLEVLSRIDDGEQRLRGLLNLALVERSSTRYREALRIHTEAAPLFGRSDNHALRGKFHNEFATVLKNLGLAERREDYIDRALVEYSASSFHLEQAGHKRFQAVVENNLGNLFIRLNKFDEAHDHLRRARALFVGLKDKGYLAQVDDTRARAFLGQGENDQAEKAARTSVRSLEDGDQLSLLAESLTTHGVALARLNSYKPAFETLRRAGEIAQRAGDPERGGLAALTIAEELTTYLPFEDLRKYYRQAEALLLNAQDRALIFRLGECARQLLSEEVSGNGSSETREPVQPSSPSACSLEEEVLRFEGGIIRKALEASGGSVTRAARLLGLTHQGLAFILNGRHRSLLSVRKPVKRRRRSIIRYR